MLNEHSTRVITTNFKKTCHGKSAIELRNLKHFFETLIKQVGDIDGTSSLCLELVTKEIALEKTRQLLKGDQA